VTKENKLLESILFDSSGMKTYAAKFGGKTDEFTTFQPDGSKMVDTKSKNCLLLKSTSHDEQGRMLESLTFNNGKPKCYTEFDPDTGRIKLKYTYTYNKNGQLQKKQMYDKNIRRYEEVFAPDTGETISKTFYDKNGNIEKSKVVFNWVLIDKVAIEIFDGANDKTKSKIKASNVLDILADYPTLYPEKNIIETILANEKKIKMHL
jgi:antitoxin component YwqK of YwqJK toxin-antitoxin module